MGFAVAERWFEFDRISDDITRIWEPHAIRLMQCNIWHVRGRDRDLLIDTGFGVASLHEAARHLFDKPVAALATHAHVDHVGSLHEFDERIIHAAEADAIAVDGGNFSLVRAEHPPEDIASLENAGYEVGPTMITAVPYAGFNLSRFIRRAAPATRTVVEGDVIDLGDRVFEVLHLPGHSPGSIGLWEQRSGTLFSGDAIYDGPLLDDLPDSDVAAYIRTMRRLEEFPARVVHGGHDASFDGQRLKTLARAYLERHGA
jgi:glyoxylase-like metal-dependent hydrolase (beta-lactamase superfamily II)